MAMNTQETLIACGGKQDQAPDRSLAARELMETGTGISTLMVNEMVFLSC